MSKHGKVLVAMSGGIDSTVTAMMLHQQGYEVVGLTMKTWDYATSGGSKKETGCCSLDSINDARMVAVDMGFHHFIIDIRDEFGDWVIDNFVQEYLAGRTPNPCIVCNTHIKWEALLRRANALECPYIATGHYAQVRQLTESKRFVVSKGLDEHKDQSYVLWGLAQQNLARTMFPVGQFQKSTIRQMARDFGYPELAKKAESYEICFIPDNDYRSFLQRRVPNFDQKVPQGNFIDATTNKVIGKHLGYPFYTIGQRKKLGTAFGEPKYVVAIKPETNTVVLGNESDLLQNTMLIKNINMVKYENLYETMPVIAKIRSQDKGAPALATQLNDTQIQVQFNASATSIAPGQSAVLYEGNDVVAGGHIEKGFLSGI